jgi:hypothetical protein
MIAYPTVWEIYDTKTDAILMAKFTAFDEESFNVSIEDKIIDSENLKKIAELLKIAEKQLIEGIVK